jgi:hypothetical protein
MILMAEVFPLVVSNANVLEIAENRDIIARVYSSGVIETYQGYSAKNVAKGVWDTFKPPSNRYPMVPSLVLFPDEHGTGLVMFNRNGKPTYREDYTPDPVARELWEAIAKEDPYMSTPIHTPEKEGTKPNPGFLGVWGTNGSIDCFRPR